MFRSNPEISYRDVGLLAMAQAMLMTGTSLLVSTSALVGRELAPDPGWATIPLGLQFLAMTLSTIPASLFMGRYGRRAGFLVGVNLGLAGTLLAGYAILTGSFPLFCAGAVLLGSFNATGQFYRFAAAEVASESLKARAIGLVLAGGIVAAFMGPNLAAWTRQLAGPDFAASYLILAGLYGIGLLAILQLHIPRPPSIVLRAQGRPLQEIVTGPVFAMAVLAAAVGYGVMNLLMVATPLAMEGHHHRFEDAAFVIQWHVVAMFLPSFFTGELIRRFGLYRILAVGVLLNLASVGVNLHGHDVIHYWLALVLLGVGWNFLFIGGTTLLTEAHRPEEKAKTQAINDFIVFGTVTVTALGSGALLATVGWMAINALVVPFLLAVLIALWFVRRPWGRHPGRG
ncbi:MAG: MFS transporter [Thioalkalivibrio sp.]|nr:MFS transporter [Thioalkalivibrio sp.]